LRSVPRFLERAVARQVRKTDESAQANRLKVSGRFG
jgi:hypothetical protein